MILDEIKNELLKISEIEGSKYRNEPITDNYYGIRVPYLRKIADYIFKKDYKQFLDNNDFIPFELEIIQAFVIGKIKDINESIYYTNLFVPLIHDWSANDTICQSLKIAKKHQKEYWDFLIKYAKSEREFEQRFVAVMMLSHYLNDEYIDEVIIWLDRLKNPGYYCKMGVAWAFATIMAKYPDKCFVYLKNNSLDKWTHNKAIQKMIESFRVLDEHKEILRKMKR
ncbi:MAG: DNA alkylation repair protein [Bacilli bacterium]|jgi:hypothetical protein